MKNSILNVLYDNHIFVIQKYGGVSRIFYELIKNLAEKENVNIFLFHGFYINHFPLEDLKKKMAFYFGKRIRPLPYTAKFLRVFNTVLFDLFKPHKKIDIFHPTDYSPAVARWKKSPLVVTVYDMIYELYPHFFKDLDIENRIQRKKRCIERADGIIAISNSTKNDLLKFYNIDEKKVRVIYPGVPSSILSKDNKNVLAHKKPFILFVGTRKRGYKNFKNLLMAFASNKKINKEFDLICFGGGAFTPEELDLITQSGCHHNFFQVSGDDDMLGQFYMNARAFVYPSLYEGFGLPPLEAMVYGCPVIASHISALPEVLGEAAVYFDPRDPASISATLEKVLFSDNKIQEMVRKGFIQAQQYSWSKMAEETYLLYNGLV
ncbi:MAG: glycosyltransferase family 4 protein [Candidatus Aminicenantes bacterium]|nr:MAG: glycosyltransferase family 4 protein [Candidatus Aminicenantes bacterium]